MEWNRIRGFRMRGSKMKYSLLAGPFAALLATAAFAQTDTTQGMGADTDRFGAGWPSSAADTFRDESRALRGKEEISTRWQSLPQSERDMIEADCRMFREEHGDTAADAGAVDGTEVEGTTQTLGTTGADSGSTTGAGEADAAVMAGYDMNEMREICEAIGES